MSVDTRSYCLGKSLPGREFLLRRIGRAGRSRPDAGTLRRLSAGAALALCGWMAVGCAQSDGWPRAAVRGRVTLDDKPLGEGQITFFPTGDTSGPAAGGQISDGEFSLAEHEGPVVGRNRIEIRSVQKTGRMVKSPVAVEADGGAVEGMMVEEFIDVVPKKYNSFSELEKEITAGKVNELDLKLQSSSTADPKP